jgi:hypothetical protein
LGKNRFALPVTVTVLLVTSTPFLSETENEDWLKLKPDKKRKPIEKRYFMRCGVISNRVQR